VRHKEFQRNAKREFGKALNLLNAYALVPCVDIGSKDKKGVRLSVSNHPDAGYTCINYQFAKLSDRAIGARLFSYAPTARRQFGPPLRPYGVQKPLTIWSTWM
jgi:hypothetical protein